MQWSLEPIREIVQRALAEDIGNGDVSSAGLFAQEVQAKAVIIAKQNGVLAGAPIAELVFRQLAPALQWNLKTADGEVLQPGQTVAELRGSVLAILAGERVALNFLQRLSGIATLTRKFADAVKGLPVHILDTRKTTPGLRILEKYAVRAGGGHNHRFGLYDGVLLKDNHVEAAGGVREAIERAGRTAPHTLKIEVEVRTLDQVQQALRANADVILLDNMSTDEMHQAVVLIRGRAQVEASGGVTLDTVRKIAETGVDFISVGALTHSAPALDLSLEVVPE